MMCEGTVGGDGKRSVRGAFSLVRTRNLGRLGLPECSCNQWENILLLSWTLLVKWRSGVD